jgi:hypothetical protein
MNRAMSDFHFQFCKIVVVDLVLPLSFAFVVVIVVVVVELVPIECDDGDGDDDDDFSSAVDEHAVGIFVACFDLIAVAFAFAAAECCSFVLELLAALFCCY